MENEYIESIQYDMQRLAQYVPSESGAMPYLYDVLDVMKVYERIDLPTKEDALLIKALAERAIV